MIDGQYFKHMTKFLGCIDADVQTTVNAWIDANITGAGPEAFSAPYSPDTKKPVTHYLTYWGLSAADQTTLLNYLSTTHVGKYSYTEVERSEIEAKVVEWELMAWDKLND